MHTKFIRWSSVIVLLSAIAPAGGVFADDHLPALGGPGGGKFEAHCPQGQLLAGFDLRAADDVDAIRPLCVVPNGPRDAGEPAAENTWYGGSGGGPARVACNRYNPVVTGIFVGYEGDETVIVNSIHLYCGDTGNTQPQNDSAAAMFDGPEIDGSSFFHTTFHMGADGTQHCPPGQPAVGLHGRSGKWVDAIGLICGPAPISPPPSPKLHVGESASARPSRSICDWAKQARASNSPTAPDLEAQCRASRLGATIHASARPIDALPASTTTPTIPAATPAILYAVGNDGRVRWYRHDGARASPDDWTGPREVDTGWQGYRQVFAGGGGVVYAITQGGVLMRLEHKGVASGTHKNAGGWTSPQVLASGWGNVVQAFSAGHGVIYAVTADGTLTWYRHTGFANGKATFEGPKKVGHGWNGLKIFSGGDGVLYTIAPDGTLRWYRHLAFMTGGALETPGAWAARRDIDHGWNDFDRVFAAGNGNIYAIDKSGQLLWYRHLGYRDGQSSWAPVSTIATGWSGLRAAFAQP